MSILTPHAICSYAQGLWKAGKVKDPVTGRESGEPRYGCELILDPAHVDMSSINMAIEAAKQEGVEKFKWDLNNLPPAFHWPIQKGEQRKPGDATYAGKLVMRVGRKEEFGPPVRVYNDGNYTPIVDQSVLYSGCVVQASVDIKCYQVSGTSLGITSYLNGIILIGDGERLDNTQTAEQMFAGVVPGSTSPNDAPAGLQTGTGGDAPAAKNPWE